jgi:hypothetical protein
LEVPGGREQPTNERVEVPQRNKDKKPTETEIEIEDLRRLLQQVLLRLRALIPLLTNTPQHPHRTVMRLFLQLLQQEQHEQGWEGLIDLLGLPTAQPGRRERRADYQIAEILYPDDMDGEHATDATRETAAQRVRTELNHARHELHGLYERQYGPLPLSINQLERILDELENNDD